MEERPEEQTPLILQSHPPRRNQILAVIGATMTLVSIGNAAGFSTVTLPSFIHPTSDIKMTSEDVLWIGSMVTIGSIVGNVIGGLVADIFGRKKALVISSLVFCIGFILIANVWNMWTVLAGRVIIGLAVGLASAPAQVYICEITDPSIRGVCGSSPSLAVTFGIIFFYSLGSTMEWRPLAYTCSAFPLIPLLYVLLFCPESPSWLISRGHHESALNSIARLRQKKPTDPQIQSEFELLKNLKQTQNFESTSALSAYHYICHCSVLKPFFVGSILFLFQAFSGIYSITSYTTFVFPAINGLLKADLGTVFVGFTRFFCVILALFLVNFIRRRTLLMTSGLLMSFANFLLGGYFYLDEEGTLGKYDGRFNLTLVKFPATTTMESEVPGSSQFEWLPLTCLVIFLIGYNIGFGLIPWFLIAEIMPSEQRSLGCAVAFAVGQVAHFAANKTFPDLVKSVGGYGTFWVYSSISLLGIIWVAAFVPETSGLDEQGIAKHFIKKRAVKKKRNVIF